MRGLAEYAMSGRRQAILVAVLFGLVPMMYPLSAAVVALVILRRGLQEGLVVLLWALLSAGLYWMGGSSDPVLILIGVTALAWLLRITQSWQKVLLAATALGLVLQLSLPLQSGLLAEFKAVVEQTINERIAAGQPLQIPQGSEMIDATPEQLFSLLMSFYGALHVLMLIASLMVARASQARLYNPGGFGQEFHNLRMDPRLMAVLFGIVVAGVYGIPPLAELLSLFCVIPLLVGLAVIHSVVASLKLGVIWLVITYLVLLLMSPVMMPVVTLLGFVDSVLDIRKRLKK
ncbi:MAG: hypothetical protein V4628_08360 [Pseudomonadota bacterium]